MSTSLCRRKVPCAAVNFLELPQSSADGCQLLDGSVSIAAALPSSA
jgi:hypothetical protein